MVDVLLLAVCLSFASLICRKRLHYVVYIKRAARLAAVLQSTCCPECEGLRWAHLVKAEYHRKTA